jgi:OOP family OmpA-OmpF porin
MKKNFSPSLALVLLSLFLGNSAAAGGFYLGVHGGLTILEDADLAVDNPGAPTLDLTLKTDRGWLAGAAAGYEWSSGVALEGELTYRKNELDKVKGMGANIDLGGDENSWAAMANAYYHLHTGTPFTPYIGAGIGVAQLTIDAKPQGAAEFKDSDTQFAYQGIAGVSYALTNQLSLGLEYRYFATTDPNYSDNPGGGNTRVASEYKTHNVLLNLIYRF